MQCPFLPSVRSKPETRLKDARAVERSRWDDEDAPGKPEYKECSLRSTLYFELGWLSWLSRGFPHRPLDLQGWLPLINGLSTTDSIIGSNRRHSTDMWGYGAYRHSPQRKFHCLWISHCLDRWLSNMFPFSVSYQASQLRVIGISISRPRPLSLVASFTLSFALLLRYPLSDFAIKVRLDAAPNFVSCVDGDGKRRESTRQRGASERARMRTTTRRIA